MVAVEFREDLADTLGTAPAFRHTFELLSDGLGALAVSLTCGASVLATAGVAERGDPVSGGGLFDYAGHVTHCYNACRVSPNPAELSSLWRWAWRGLARFGWAVLLLFLNESALFAQSVVTSSDATERF